MARDPLEEQLRAWGHAQVGRHAANDDADTGPGSHPIARAREFAPMTRDKFARQVAGRDGRDRRRMMAGKSGVKGMRIVPMWACDPVAGKESKLVAAPDAQIDRGIPPEVKWIDRAAIELYRQNTLRGLVLRMEYCGFGFQSDKAAAVSSAIGSTITLRQYREELRLAREWMRGRIAA